MSHSPLARGAGPLCVAASVLVVLSQLLRLGLGAVLGPGSTATVAHTVTYGIALLGTGVLLLALVALYVRTSQELGRLGLVGFVAAFLGTLLVAGDWWFEAFAVPTIATAAPGVLAGPPGWSLIAGALTTIGLYTVGWVLFGIAIFRAGVFGRPTAVLLIIGGALGTLALSTPYQIPLAIAVGWIGLSLQRTPTDAPEAMARGADPRTAARPAAEPAGSTS